MNGTEYETYYEYILVLVYYYMKTSNLKRLGSPFLYLFVAITSPELQVMGRAAECTN
jgi:hypothetical protein